jgi:hypothetical protein
MCKTLAVVGVIMSLVTDGKQCIACPYATGVAMARHQCWGVSMVASYTTDEYKKTTQRMISVESRDGFSSRYLPSSSRYLVAGESELGCRHRPPPPGTTPARRPLQYLSDSLFPLPLSSDLRPSHSSTPIEQPLESQSYVLTIELCFSTTLPTPATTCLHPAAY